MGERYAADPDLIFFGWAGEAAALVYARRTANTHLVDEAAWQVLKAATAGEVSAAALLASHEADASLVQGHESCDDDRLEEVTAILVGLLNAGLLRRVA